MNSKMRRWLCWVVGCLVLPISYLPQSAGALDTANVLYGIDGMVMLHDGVFRNGEPTDGNNTFSYGTFQSAAGTLGRYNSFYMLESAVDDCCIAHRNRIESWAPWTWSEEGESYQIVPGLNLSTNYFPVLDRAAYGQRFDPEDYQIEVKFRPNLGVTGLPDNEAAEFDVSLDQHFGFVFNEQKGIYERAMEQIHYSIGINSAADYNEDGQVNEADHQVYLDNFGQTFTLPNENPDAATPGVVDYEDLVFWQNRNGRVVTPINDWYATAEKDDDGFATWSVPVLNSVDSERSTYFNYGDNVFRDENVVTGGGRVFNSETSQWEDNQIAYGEGFSQFGGGPVDPNDPGSKMDTPNGVSTLYYGRRSGYSDPLSVEIRSIALKKIESGPIAARLDEDSGLSFVFGSGFTRGPDFDPIPIPNDPFGLGYLPPATDQISRFDENGMTNLIFNMREPDDPPPPPGDPEVHRFFLRFAPGPNTFDGTQATLNVRARLTETLGDGIADTLTVVAKDLDGNDNQADPVGADEYRYDIDLSQFNTETFTTISVPLSDFSLMDFVAETATEFGSGPGGFAFPGDGSIADFNLYEFGGLLAPNSGLLKLELDFMELRLPESMMGLAGDYNNDGVVGAADYVVWRNNLGGDGSLLPNRDPNFTGPISQDDYDFWVSQYGNTLGGSASSAAVPEPSGLLLISGLLIGLLAADRRRSR